MESLSLNREKIYDPLRKMWLQATPEEKVRQALLATMLGPLGYPKHLISVERALDQLPTREGASPPPRRVDVVAFASASTLKPLLLIECKECSSLKEQARAQVIGYNYFIQAYFVAIAYPSGFEWGYYDSESASYRFSLGLPSYKSLLEVIADGYRGR
jgi:hypothetical protein